MAYGPNFGPTGPTMGSERLDETDRSKDTMKGYWKNYQKWTADAKMGFEQKASSVKARLSAGGIKAGSEQWNTNLARLESEYDEDIAGIDKGVTATELRKWSTKRQEGEYLKGISIGAREGGYDHGTIRQLESNALAARKDSNDLGMSDYLGATFGETDNTPEKTAAEKATKSAERSASGSTATGSPWW